VWRKESGRIYRKKPFVGKAWEVHRNLFAGSCVGIVNTYETGVLTDIARFRFSTATGIGRHQGEKSAATIMKSSNGATEIENLQEENRRLRNLLSEREQTQEVLTAIQQALAAQKRELAGAIAEREQRETSDPNEIMAAAAEAIGRYLRTNRVGFFEMKDDETLAFGVSWTDGRLPLLTGLFPATGIGTRYLAEVRAGKTLGMADAALDPLTADSLFGQIGARAVIGAPIIRSGRWHAGLYVHHAEVREWAEDEIALVRAVADQTWDAVEHARTQTALRANKESLDLAIDGAQLGTFFCEVPFDKVLWNTTCKAHFFLPPEAQVDFDLFYARLHPDDREPTRQAIDRAIRDHTQYNVEYRVVAPDDGRIRWINAIGKGFYTPTGEPTRLDGITIDITETKNQERALNLLVAINDATRALQEPEAIMATVARLLGEHLGVSRCAYAPVDEDQNHFTIYEDYTDGCASSAGRYTLAAFGPRAVAELRQGHTYILNNRNLEVTPEDDLAAFDALDIHAIICTSLIKAETFTAMMAVHQNEPRRWTTEEIQLVEMVAGRSWAIIEHARADKALKQHSAEINSLNARLRNSVTETHHRVKNNLQMISAMIEMQMAEHSAEKTVPLEAFQQLKAHVHTLATVHELLTQSVREEEDAQRISAKVVLDRLLPMLHLTSGNCRIRYSVEEAQLTSKQCISLALVVNELLTNALKHGKRNAEVLLRREQEGMALEVLDDGPGFPEGFDPLLAANMGLEIVESLIKTDLKGHSYYETRDEGGGRVRVLFPLPPAEP
jgi:GAF domain-containing protein